MDRKKDKVLQCKVTVRMMTDEKAFGPGVAELLSGVQRTGSLQGAAQAMHMPYSKAWTVVRAAEQIWGFPLTERQAGGSHGGHSRLTKAAEILLQRYEKLEEKVNETAKREFELSFNPSEIAKLKELGHETT